MSENTKHTPGPWTVGGLWETDAYMVRSERGASGLPGMPAIACGGSGRNALANARLIAAAPAMWRLLSLVMDDDDTRAQYEDAWQPIVAQVEGRQMKGGANA